MDTQTITANSANSPSINPAPTRGKASVAAGFVTGMLSGLVRARRDPLPLLRSAGIDPAVLADAAVRVPVDRYADLYNRINAELDDEAFGLLSTPMRVGSFEFLCRSAVSSATLDEALRRSTRFLRIVLPDLALTVTRERDMATLVVAETRPLAAEREHPARVFAFEWLLRLVHGLSCWLVGRGIALDSVRFPYARPGHADDYTLIYTERSEFGAARLEARFQSNLLDLPVRRDDAALETFLDGAPGKLVMLYRRDRDTVRRVRDLLRSALPASLPLATVAARLHLSERTLHRRLGEEGSSYRAIKDALRRDLALSRLSKGGDPVARIAADLGYADTSTFYRAFVEWTGMAPAHYRARLAAAG